MTFRFQKRIKLFKGVRLNLSKSSVSTSLGKTGAQLTVGRQTRATVGLPGTGLSYTATASTDGNSRRTTRAPRAGAASPASAAGSAFMVTLIMCFAWNIMTKFHLGIIASVAISSAVAYLAYKGRVAAQAKTGGNPDA